MLEQAGSFRKQIYSLGKYESYYRLGLMESVEALRVRQKEYQQSKAALLKKKDKLYSDKVEKWQAEVKLTNKPPKQEAFPLMLPKETRVLLSHRMNFGLHCYQFYEENHRHLRDTPFQMCPDLL